VNDVAAIRWDAPGPYVVAFTTRLGGVSEGPYESLNLGVEGDEPARVAENRRRACAAVGLDAARLAVNRQRHSPAVHRAQAGRADEPGDGLWTDEPELPILALAADCLPIAVAATAPRRPALAVLHAGWRGLADGVVEAGVRAVGGGPAAAVVGPAVGPCCYEVGPEVSARFDTDLTHDGILDLWSAAERALRRAGVATVERVDVCTRCNPELYFSHRRSGPVRGVQGVVGAVAG
jgi:YfiH family protein